MCRFFYSSYVKKIWPKSESCLLVSAQIKGPGRRHVGLSNSFWHIHGSCCCNISFLILELISLVFHWNQKYRILQESPRTPNGDCWDIQPCGIGHCQSLRFCIMKQKLFDYPSASQSNHRSMFQEWLRLRSQKLLIANFISHYWHRQLQAEGLQLARL